MTPPVPAQLYVSNIMYCRDIAALVAGCDKSDPYNDHLSFDFDADTGADGASTFTNGEGDALFHRDRLD
jgi:hypothetical protein